MIDQSVCLVVAPAKLTLSLRVTGVRSDGYHLLDAEMVSLDLADTLEMTLGSGITVVDEVVGGVGVSEVPLGAQNLVNRALELVGRTSAVRLVKRIPPGSGLGGGSADAAAVLRWAGRTDPALAAQLGADVPFCVAGGRARVRGVGERVEPLTFEDRRFVLLLPPVSQSTAAVYRAWDEWDETVTRHGRRPDHTRAELEDTPRGEVNDLEAAALRVQPALALWRDRLHEETGLRPRLAGSGSAWFVEGDPASLGLADRRFLEVGGRRATLVPARTVPAARR